MQHRPNSRVGERVSGCQSEEVSVTRRALFRLLAPLALLAVVAGCCQVPGGRCRDWWCNGFKVGPNYSRPQSPVASEWIDYANPRVKSEEQQLSAWWTVFNDPTLNQLIETAYQQNLTLREAGARILEARAQLGIAQGNLFPQSQSAFGDYSRVKLSTNTANPPASAWFSNWDAGLTASWELDFWGRYRRAIEAADAGLDASVEDYDDVLVVLLSDVAASYVQYRTFEQRLVYARANVEIQRLSYQLADDKFKAGATTERDVQQAKQVLEQTEALIPTLEIGKRQAANRLCVLLGMPPTNLEAILGTGTGVPVAPLDVAVGVPADLIRRRPDVRRAERQVAAQSARIGLAVSDLYPHISILGTIGVEAAQFGNLFKTPGSMIGEIGPGVRWDILNYGRLVNNVRVQDARFQQLAYAYQNQVLDAGREVEDAIVLFLRSQEQSQHLDASVEAAARTVKITTEQYNEGFVDFTPVYLFQSILTQQQDQSALAQGDIALGLIAVYRALGGGWEIRLNDTVLEANAATMPQPFQELPPPEAAPNDIRFQSFLFESATSEMPRDELRKRSDGALPETTSMIGHGPGERGST
ncbi:MAG: efflux transporter outer membrane subunit [Pirellulales bacterium]|nr:efflux transporter outer membrane subunit [Pirellulales bacterium]